MECVTRVFYNDLPSNSHPFHVCVCVDLLSKSILTLSYTPLSNVN